MHPAIYIPIRLVQSDRPRRLPAHLVHQVQTPELPTERNDSRYGSEHNARYWKQGKVQTRSSPAPVAKSIHHAICHSYPEHLFFSALDAGIVQRFVEEEEINEVES